VQPPRRAPEVQLLGDGDEVPGLLDLHIETLSLLLVEVIGPSTYRSVGVYWFP
jgi:hypothetical protein